MNPASKLSDPERAMAADVEWEADPEDAMWFRGHLDGEPMYLRINNFPDENLYSLWVGDGVFVELEDMPPGWRRVGPLEWPSTARPRRSERSG